MIIISRFLSASLLQYYGSEGKFERRGMAHTFPDYERDRRGDQQQLEKRKGATRMKRTYLAFLLIALLAVTTGCQLTKTDSSTPVEPPDNPAETVIDLDSPTGGFTYEDEVPAFGEEELFAPFMNETAISDEYEEDPDIQKWIHHKHAKIYRLRALWGRLAIAYRDTLNGECCPLDWTGGMRLNGGAIIIERTIAFDCNDSVERVDRSTIRWVSHTCPHIDGIQVRLIVPPPPRDSSNTDVAEPTLTIRTGPYSNTFTMDELEALEMMVPVDRCGNGISLNSHIKPPYCPHGHLVGAWRRIEPDTIMPPDTNGVARADTVERGKIILGVFRGIWFSDRGHMAGFVRGVYGLNSAGEQVFFGKYIDFQGRFRGIMRGAWGINPTLAYDSVNEMGYFHGVWMGRNEMVEGRLKGHWFTGPCGHGYFHGVWGMNCTNAL